MNRIYTVIYTELGDSSDHLASVYGTYSTKKEARKAMERDVEDYCINNELEQDDYGDAIVVGDEEYGCQWQIIECRIPNE